MNPSAESSLHSIYSAVSKETIAAKANDVYAYMISGQNPDSRMNIHLWDWIPGVGLMAIMHYYELTGNTALTDFLFEWVTRNEEKSELNRTINSTAPFAIYPQLYRIKPNETYLHTVRRTAEWLLNEAPRTREGAFEHTVTENAIFPEQVWADTVYMAVLFLARAASVLNDRHYAEQALRQLELHMQLLQDPETGVLFHGWNCGERSHMSAARWTRANAWVALGFPLIVKEIRGLAAISDQSLSSYKRLIDGLAAYQKPDGMWSTVTDRPSFYNETSGSAGIASGIVQAVKQGLLDAAYLQPASRTLQAVVGSIASNGSVQGVSGGTPVKPSIDDYNRIPLKETLYGQGLVLMLLADALDGFGQQQQAGEIE